MKYLYNYVEEQQDKDGFFSFHRFFAKQMQVYSKDAMSRTMSESTAGMYLGFYTTGSKISMECKKENRLKLILPIVRQVKLKTIKKMMKQVNLKELYSKKSKLRMDGMDVVVNGSLVETIKVKKGIIHLQLRNLKNEKLKVQLFFPVIESIQIRNVKIQGVVTPLERRGHMLSLGDSITQGMIAGAPSQSYTSLLGEYLNLDVLNQGVGGYVFNHESLIGLEKLALPKLITVAYGTNDWTNKDSLAIVQKDAQVYMHRLLLMFPKTRVFLITPIWRADSKDSEKSEFPFEELQDMLWNVFKTYPYVTVIDGNQLVDHNTELYSDSFLHPNSTGFAQMAKRLAEIIESNMM